MLEHWEQMFEMPFPSPMLSLGRIQLHNLLEGGSRQPGEHGTSTSYDRYIHKTVIID